MHMTTISEKKRLWIWNRTRGGTWEVMDWGKERGEGIRRGKSYNYIIISKIKAIVKMKYGDVLII